MFKLTPNSIKRPAGVPLEYEKVADGMWVVKNAYEGHYEYFEGRPLPDPKAPRPQPVGDAASGRDKR